MFKVEISRGISSRSVFRGTFLPIFVSRGIDSLLTLHFSYAMPPALLHAVTLLRALHDLHRGECQMVEVLSAEEKDDRYIFEVEDTEAVLAPGRFLWTPIPWFKSLSNIALRSAFLTFGESGKFMALQHDLIKSVLGGKCLSNVDIT